MGEIMEVFDDIKDSIGAKPFYILVGVAVVFGLYNLVKGSGESQSTDELVAVTSVSSYPDAVTNANVIIDSLQNSIDYSENVIVEEIQGLEETVTENFEATNDYINDGFNAQLEMTDKITSDLESSVTEIKDMQASLDKAVNSIKNEMNGKTPAKPVSNTLNKTSSGTGVSYYTYKAKKGLNTSTSIVDALKSIGVDSSMSNRSKIAKANGISNYKGTAEQNIKMLSLLKSGKLKKV